jgi:hypothetical protein
MNKGTGIAEQISPFYGTVIAEHSHKRNYDVNCYLCKYKNVSFVSFFSTIFLQ